MAEKKNDSSIIALDVHSEAKGEVYNADDLRLQQMGHTQELTRHFRLGLGLATEIGAGGPGAVIYGFILITVLQSFLGASLAEFVSSYPTSGGMYHWIAAVSPERYRGFLSFNTGFFTIMGWVFTTASTNLIYAQNFMALVALYHPTMTIKTWQTFLVYQVLNLVTAAIVIWGNRIIPALNKFSLFYLQIGWFVVMVTVVACAPSHQDSEFVFRTWINETGWENQVICFITGLVNPLYSLGGLDGVTHLTEEMPNPSRNAPLAIAITLVIAFVTGITYLIALMFSVQDYAALSSTNTGLPLAELFRQVTRNAGGTFGLTFILFIALGPCVISSQLSTGRMFWAFSRDGAIPFSSTWSKVNHRLQMPMNAQLAVTAIVAALGCLYLGSSTAFNSLLGSAVTINNCAYMVPILTNLLTGRRNMYKGVFHMHGAKGFFVNTITVCWLAFAIVFFSFPYYKPVTAANMNYTCIRSETAHLKKPSSSTAYLNLKHLQLQSRPIPNILLKMHFSSWTPLVVSLFTISTTAIPLLEVRKNGGGGGGGTTTTRGGPASAKVTLYNQYTCVAPNTPPPTDGSAGTVVSFSVTEAQCTIQTTGLQFGGALTASLTATPKTGTVGCYIVGHSQQGCGIVLSNQMHGWPVGGINVGDSLGCGNPPSGTSYLAFEIICQ
ncbi:amino acid permease, partial [Aureobasidium melanogenum]